MTFVPRKYSYQTDLLYCFYGQYKYLLLGPKDLPCEETSVQITFPFEQARKSHIITNTVPDVQLFQREYCPNAGLSY